MRAENSGNSASGLSGVNAVILMGLWGVVALYAAMTAASSLLPGSVSPSGLVLLLLAFVLLHGALRYGWGGILVFIVIALAISNILENVSILTGFPFGHYVYTDALGPKLFLVPVLIGPAYIGTGYLAWVIATVLVGDVRRDSSVFTLIATPVIASFAMVVWDICFDPTLSTILKFWVWKQGGGYFGVPLTNYLGWYLTVYLFIQAFALYVRFGPRRARTMVDPVMPRQFSFQAIVAYAVIGLSFVLQYAVAVNRTVTDATGATWQTSAIHETAAIVSLYTMFFIAVLAAIKLVQAGPATPPAPTGMGLEMTAEQVAEPAQ